MKKEFTSSEGKSQAHITDMKTKGVDKINAKKVDVPDMIIYIFLKFRLLQARINKSIGMNHIAHDICNSIILFVKLFKD